MALSSRRVAHPGEGYKTGRLRLKIRVVIGEGVKFGDGRAELLELIDELGSITQAVTRFGRSYRNARDYL